jgi:alkylation response protein AidB-like acyl-CoA dehydrogenase
MDFDYSDRTREYMDHLSAFMDEHVFPAEAIYDEEVSKGEPWQPTEVMERLKDKAKELGVGAVPAHSRWSRRGASRPDRPARATQTSLSRETM